MKVPLPLLSSWITLDKSPADIAAALTAGGLEVDSIEGRTLEVSLTPNLSHCMSLFGIARELSALFNIPLKEQTVAPIKKSAKSTDECVKATVEDSSSAPFYSLLFIDGVTVGPSPAWLLDALKLLGIKSINNIVDVTNYVMHMIGQPLHAFDAAKIPSKKIVVRKARTGESLEVLDGRTVELTNEMLIIADDKKPLALAGVMGGSASAISDQTTSILLESAHFSAPLVRRTSKKSHTSTESSKRFERGHDPNLCLKALDFAASLIQQVAGGAVAKEAAVIKAHDFPCKTLVLRLSKIHQILGLHLSLNEAEELLQRLGFSISFELEETLQVKVPTWRADVTSEIDLVEEVARLYGLNNIPRKKSLFRLSSLASSPLYLFSKELEQKALQLGLQQLLTSDLIGPKDIAHLPSQNNLIRVNASAQEQSILRPSLLPGLLSCLKHNLDFKQSNFAAFEIGHVYYTNGSLFQEEEKMAILLHGNRSHHHWSHPSSPFDYFDIKGMIEGLVGPCESVKSQIPVLHPYNQGELILENEKIAFFGQINPFITNSFGIDTPVFFAEINISLWASFKRTSLRFIPLPLYPSTERDLTLTLREETLYEQLLKTIEESRGTLLEKVCLVSVYRHESLGAGHKNLTLRFSFRSPQKTLSFEEAEQEFARLSVKLESSYGVKAS